MGAVLMADLIGKRRSYGWLIGLLTVLGALVPGAGAQDKVIKLLGSEVTLVPRYSGDLEEIKWLLNDTILVEIVLKPQEDFLTDLASNRSSIDRTNGALTIKNLTIGDSGNYKAEALVDNVAQDTEIRLAVRDCPAEPTISDKSTKDQIVLICESSSPDITYEWFNQTRSVSKNSSYSQPGPKKNGTLTCVVDNEVCNKTASIQISYIPEPSGLSGGIVALIVILVILVIGGVLYVFYKKFWKRDKIIAKIPELERCITVKFLTYAKPIDNESHGLLEDQLKRMQSLFMAIHGVKKADHGHYTAEALLPNGKTCTFTKERGGAVIIKSEDDIITLTVPNREDVTKLIWKKDGVTQFEWMVSGLKLRTDNIVLEPGSVTVNKTEEKGSYKVDFHPEESPESRPIGSVTFHPIKMTGMTQITWKKDGHSVNIGGNRIQPGPNGELTVNNVTSEDEGKYIVQCKDKNLEQEFLLHV